jgi:hypothetical protein
MRIFPFLGQLPRSLALLPLLILSILLVAFWALPETAE